MSETDIREAFEHNEPGKNTRPMLNWAHRPADC